MKPKTNNDVLDLMNEFLSPIRHEKQAMDNIDEIKSESGKPQTEEVNKPAGENQGEFGSEKHQDIEKGTDGVTAQSSEADVKEGDADKPTDDQGTKTLDSEQAVSQETVNVTTTTDPADDNDKNNKGETGGHDAAATQKQAAARNMVLANLVMSMLDEEGTPAVEKEAAELPATDAEQMMKTAAEEAHDDFVQGFMRGMEKRAEDREELVKVGMSPEQADAILDKIAMEDPEAVLPEEAMPEEAAEAILGGAGAEGAAPMADAAGEAGAPVGLPEEGAEMGAMGGEDEAALQELAQQLESQGVTPEDLVEAANTVAELEQAGVSPEEIVQAVQQMAGEGGPEAGLPGLGGEEAPIAEGAPGVEAAPELPPEMAPEAAAPEAAPEVVPEELEKVSQARIDVIKDHLRGLAENK